MQSMSLNKQKIFYATYSGISDVLVDGKKTGQKTKAYSVPTEYWINVSYARGNVNIREYGINFEHTRGMVTNDMNCPIENDSVLWIDTLSTNKPNYIVTRKSKSLNGISYEIKEISES